MLTTAELDTIRQRLAARRTELADRVEQRLHGHGLDRHAEAGLPKRSEDTDDDAAAETQREADLVHLSRAAEELAVIEQALSRIENGEFGACAECGGDIERPRLDANPMAIRCAECQTLFERRARRSAGRG